MKRFFKWIRRGLGFLIILILATLLVLSVNGVPQPLVHRLTDRIQDAGYYVRIGTIHLDPLNGLIANRFVLYGSAAFNDPLISFDVADLTFNPLDWLRGETGLNRVRVHNGTLQLETAGHASPECLKLEHLNLDVTFDRPTWIIHPSSAEFRGLKLLIKGNIHHPMKLISGEPSATPPPAPPQQPAGATPRANLHDWINREAPVFATVARQLDTIQFRAPPNATVEFDIEGTNLPASTASLELKGVPTRIRDIELQRWGLSARLADGVAILEHATVQNLDQTLALTGKYDLARREVSADLRARLRPDDWLHLLPADWRAAAGLTTNTSCSGPMELECHAGPVAVDKILSHINGRMTLAEARYSGVALRQGQLVFHGDADAVYIDSIELTAGEGAQAGVVRGSGTYGLSTSNYAFTIESVLDPHSVIALLNSNIVDTINALTFSNEPPHGTSTITGNTGTDTVRFESRIQATNFTYNAVPVAWIDAVLTYADPVLTFTNMTLVRPEGRITGWFTLDLDHNLARFAINSSVDPHSAARLIDPDLDAYLSTWLFRGGVAVAATGQLDYGSNLLTDARAHIDVRRLQHGPYEVARCEADVLLRGPQISVTNIMVAAYDGVLCGHVRCYPAAAGSNMLYQVSLRADDLELHQILSIVSHKTESQEAGRIHAACDLRGSFNDPQQTQLAGTGWMYITDGDLVQISLLGEFARLFGYLYPGFGTLVLTDASATFNISNRVIRVDNGKLSGTRLAILGQGKAGFDGALDFDIKVHLESTSALMSVVRVVTSPLTRFTDLHLGGTVEKPKWWPMSLTKKELSSLPKDLLIELPVDLLINLPKDVLTTFPQELLIKLPREVLITLPKELLINLPKELLIDKPRELYHRFDTNPKK